MPYRNIVFANNEIYHTYNRSVAKVPIFQRTKDYSRFLDVVNFYRNEKPPLRYSFFNRLEKERKEEFLEALTKRDRLLVEIYAFCLMPNHFHFLLKQLRERGIADFMRNLQNSYAKYFNLKYKRSGSLFQALFKAVRIETTEQLLHVSRYIHLNLVSSFIIKLGELENYPWSSFGEYMGLQRFPFANTTFILENFRSPAQYKEFIYDQADYQRALERIKHLALEA